MNEFAYPRLIVVSSQCCNRSRHVLTGGGRVLHQKNTRGNAIHSISKMAGSILAVLFGLEKPMRGLPTWEGWLQEATKAPTFLVRAFNF